jgi:sec-independent protein translocase protein TatC
MKLIPSRKTPEQRTGEMTVVEHLQELRRRIIICVYAVAISGVAAWFLYGPFKNALRKPYCDFVAQNPQNTSTNGCDLVVTGPIDPMMTKLKIVLFIAIAIALPILLYQLWAFIVPGLTSREKKWSIPFVLTSFFLFVVGALFAYYTLPRALGFLLGFAGPGVVSLLTFDRYVSFVMLVALAFGLSFLLPILLVFLELIGVVTPQWLSKNRRYAVFLIFLFAAIITPSSDPYTMTAMAVPMYLLYEAAIIVGRLAKRGQRAAETG